MEEERKPFHLPENTATLVLDGIWEGVEVDVNLSVGWDVYDAIGRWLEHWRNTRGEVAAQGRAIREAAEIFSTYALRGWNLHQDNQPVATTTDGLMSIRDPQLLPTLMGAWIDVLGTVPDPLTVRD